MPTKSEISFIRSLADKREREEHGLFVVEGPKMVAEALASGWKVKKVYGCGLTSAEGCERSEQPDAALRVRLPELLCNSELFEEVSFGILERMSSLRTPQGVLAIVEMPLQNSERADGQGRLSPAAERRRQVGGLTIALDGIQDPGNLGTIMRTADWFGVRRILCSPDCADRFNPKAVQASMGAIFRIPVSYGELAFPDGVPVYGAFLDGESIYDTDFAPDGIVVLGSEGRGISAAVGSRVTHRITIPSFSPRAESLNVAAVAAIICSEVRRGRATSGRP